MLTLFGGIWLNEKPTHKKGEVYLHINNSILYYLPLLSPGLCRKTKHFHNVHNKKVSLQVLTYPETQTWYEGGLSSAEIKQDYKL